ncbi:MAG: SHOCT domain-containing protein [Chloroflexota bacterium]|nr:SHOCT domain-containing protein [Chloroflexota bacterium]
MPPRRRAARRTGRRTARRTSHRVHRRRRRRRRRIIIGGAVMVTAGAAAYGAYKLSTQDVERIEEKTDSSVEELSDEELQGAMKDLNIQPQEMTEEDKAALQAQGGAEGVQAGVQPVDQGDYLDELEQLADLRDRGILTEDEFQAKKKEILGL